MAATLDSEPGRRIVGQLAVGEQRSACRHVQLRLWRGDDRNAELFRQSLGDQRDAGAAADECGPNRDCQFRSVLVDGGILVIRSGKDSHPGGADRLVTVGLDGNHAHIAGAPPARDVWS